MLCKLFYSLLVIIVTSQVLDMYTYTFIVGAQYTNLRIAIRLISFSWILIWMNLFPAHNHATVTTTALSTSMFGFHFAFLDPQVIILLSWSFLLKTCVSLMPWSSGGCFLVSLKSKRNVLLRGKPSIQVPLLTGNSLENMQRIHEITCLMTLSTQVSCKLFIEWLGRKPK